MCSWWFGDRAHRSPEGWVQRHRLADSLPAYPGGLASGISLSAAGTTFERFEIQNVEPGSAGAIAGLHKGDIITAVKGQVPTELGLDSIKKIFQYSGRTVHLSIRRNGKTIEVSIKLKEMI